MQSIALALPIFPGKTEEFKKMGQELMGEKKKQFEESHARTGITSEKWFIQSTPHGDMIIVYLEADDIGKMFGAFGQSKDAFDVWMKEMYVSFHGVDFNKPPQGPPPQQILNVP